MNDPSQPQSNPPSVVPKRQLSPDVDTSPTTSSTSTKRQQTVAAHATATSSGPASTNQEYTDLLSNIVEFDKKYGSYPFSNNENLYKFFSEWSSRDYENIIVLRETINKLENRFDVSNLEEESYVNNLGDDEVAIFNLWKKIWGKKGDDHGEKKDLTQQDDSKSASKDSSSKQYEASTGRSDGISDHKKGSSLSKPNKGNDWIEDTSVIGDDTDSKEKNEDTFDGMPRAPVPTEMGEGGALYMPGMNENQSTVAVFKPMAKEAKCQLRPLAGIRKGTIAGEGYLREAAAYQLDHPIRGDRGETRVDPIGFLGVPPTCIVKIHDPLKKYKTEGIGSLQKFVPNAKPCEWLSEDDIKAFPISEVHKIAVMDLRFANADQNLGNILRVMNPDGPRLIPIDHGYCWPYTSTDIFRTATLVLQRQAEKGSSPFEIGKVMSRYSDADIQSMMENVINEVQNALPKDSTEEKFMEEIIGKLDYWKI
nr:hypothetical protein [Tanacetum cinerariifolium]